MSANPYLPPAAADGAPSPQQVLELLTRVSAETTDVRNRLLALTEELDAAAQRLQALCAPTNPVRLAAVADPPAAIVPQGSPEAASPAYHVAVEMAVAGYSRDEAHHRLTHDFAITDPAALLDDVYGFHGAAGA